MNNDFNADDARKLAEQVNLNTSHQLMLEQVLKVIKDRAVGGHKTATATFPSTKENQLLAKNVISDLRSRGFLAEDQLQIIGDQIYLSVAY
ncbi:hypothetical protein [uncultured Acinetobacter sp.]|uniref:hypothetical protein n=1 Tax=uncultured Acinetobacter sp. TaxID=165433 RepID=UPI002582BC19|nr:hypothetical protein [uncultured Acinetobacter sp.]